MPTAAFQKRTLLTSVDSIFQQETDPINTPPVLQTPQFQLTVHTPENIMDVSNSMDTNLQPPPAPKSQRHTRVERSIFANVNPMPALSPLTPR